MRHSEAWIASSLSLLAMTPGHISAFSRRNAPELCMEVASPKNERAQGMPGARCTRGLVCKMHKGKRTRAYRFSGGNPAFPARWFYGLFRALPGDRAFLPPSPAEAASRELDASVGASGPHDFAVRLTRRSSSVAKASTASRPNVRDDGQRPSARGGTVQSIILILANRELKYFLPRGWTRCLSGTRLICPPGKIGTAGWVEPSRNPSSPQTAIDGYRVAPPILRIISSATRPAP